MIRASNLFWSCFVFILILFFCSCSNERNPMEFGTLLWVDKTMPDSLVKKAVKVCLDNTSMIACQITWSPNDTSFFKNVEWYGKLANEGKKSFMLNLDWQNLNRTGTSGDWNFGKDSTDLIFYHDVLRLSDLYQPKYISLGVEVNYYALTNPDGFKSFVTTFNKLKSELKQRNSEIQVGVTFQLELLFGRHSGWNRTKCIEPLISMQENLDFIGISTYPDVFEPNSEWNKSIQYLDSLELLSNKPKGISETGISSVAFNNSDRRSYVKGIINKARDKGYVFMVWGSLIDSNANGDWCTAIGLMDIGGTYKNEFEIWSHFGMQTLNMN